MTTRSVRWCSAIAPQLAEMLRQFQTPLRQALAPSAAPVSTPSQRSSSATAPARPKCPRCGSDMVLRRVKTGQHAGREFWGCSMFSKTKCGGIREVE